MQTVRVKCPNCNVTLDVKNSTDVDVKNVECPRCKTRLKVKFKKDSETTHYDSSFNPATGQLYTPPQPAIPPQSEEGGTMFMSIDDSGKMGKLLHGSTIYPLQIGINTIGRKASTSPASIQINTPDRSMSRSHAVIEVSKLYDGRVHTVIRNSENKNPTFVGGHLLVDSDRIILNNGDVIKMGEVTLTFVSK